MGEDPTPPVRHTTVAEAAAILGISAEAVRDRIRRGTLPVEREGGTVYVILALDESGRTDLLIGGTQDRIQTLEEANRENRRIIAALTQRIPAIETPAETPQEPPESPTAAAEQPGRVEP